MSDAEDRIERALRVLDSCPTPEEMNDEGFCMAHFLSQMACAVTDILEGTD